MSIRIYTGPHADGRRAPVSWQWVPWMLAGITIGGQIIWLLAPAARDALTIITVITFALASVTHAWLNRGAWWAAGYFAIAAGIGLAVEAIGVSTGIPFGQYSYAGTLGPALLGVPVLVPLAWAMMAYPCLLAARRLSSTRAGVTIIGAWLLASWDIFLDPQMVAEGHWAWANPDPGLPGVPGIPLTNYLGWILTALLMMYLLDRLPPRTAPDGVPALMLAWVYFSNVLGNAVFFDRPWVALWGGILMGIVVIPWAWVTWTTRP